MTFEELKIGMYIMYSDKNGYTIDKVIKVWKYSFTLEVIESTINRGEDHYKVGCHNVYDMHSLFLNYTKIVYDYKIKKDIERWIDENN